jgi:hypothetical protein
MSSYSIIDGTSFTGKASLEGLPADFTWTFSKVTGNNLQFHLVLSVNGQVVEESNGSGSFIENESADQANYVLEDTDMNYKGVYDYNSGKFNGTLTRKDGSMEGVFDLKRV